MRARAPDAEPPIPIPGHPNAMNRAYPRAPALGVGAVVFKGERVLLVRRRTPPACGTWIFPGGRVELGETLREAVVREVEEESGWSVEVVRLVELFDYIDRDAAGRVRYHYILADYFCRYAKGELVAGSDVSEARLVPLADIRKYDLSERATQVIEAARRMDEAERRPVQEHPE